MFINILDTVVKVENVVEMLARMHFGTLGLVNDLLARKSKAFKTLIQVFSAHQSFHLLL
jgi:hypothetical protein